MCSFLFHTWQASRWDYLYTTTPTKLCGAIAACRRGAKEEHPQGALNMTLGEMGIAGMREPGHKASRYF